MIQKPINLGNIKTVAFFTDITDGVIWNNLLFVGRN